MSFWSNLFVSLSSKIQEAVEAGDFEGVKELLDRRANVNAAPNKERLTLLHKASYRGNKKMAELLLTKGANVNAKARTLGTPLHSAATGTDTTIETRGHLEVTKLLLASGADINARDNIGWTPTYKATFFERWGTAELLRRHGGRD